MALTLKQARRRQRNAAIVAAYLEQPDLSQRELADRFGLSHSRVSIVINLAGARDDQRQSRIKHRQHSEGLYAAVDFGPRKRSHWPECPPDLRDDYRALRRKGLTGTEARAALEAGRRA